ATIFNLDNSNVAGNAGIKASKLEGEFSLGYSQTGPVVSDTHYLRIVRGANATVLALQAAITEAVATGADRTVTLDLQKSTGGSAFATILAAPVQFTSGSALRAVSAAVISSASLTAGDVLRLVVTAGGSAGAQAQGLAATVTLREDPN
ncbi:MAG TPA: hypothetical protein VFA26_05385, partial [Gemmataceae bacterium]|nr:hypothetical protein [Gemmataceae bacterium]